LDIVIDTSALLAVILAEPERGKIIQLTAAHTLIGPGSISWEIGNAFSALLKKKRIGLSEAHQGMKIFNSIPLRYVTVDMDRAISISHGTRTYAYDAYFLDCALRQLAPLLTLDQALVRSARKLGIKVLEV
jgi:predicted nucleic acid-binding protein